MHVDRQYGLGTVAAAALAAVALVSPASAPAASVAHASLPGPNPAVWQRPAPLVVTPWASPTTAVHREGGRSEGQLFLDSLDPAERQQLLRERVVLIQQEDPDSPSAQSDDDAAIRGFIRALALFDQPKARAIELMFEPENLALFLEELDGAATVERVPEVGELTQFTVEFLFWDIDFWIQHWFYPEHSRYEWFLDTEHYDNDIDGNKGFWQIYALDDGRSVGEYGVVVDTGIPIPKRWIERIQRRQIPEAMQQFQRYIDSGGTYRKD